MAIINFSVPEQLHLRIKNYMKRKGIATKAEFFRYAALQSLERGGYEDSDEELSELASDQDIQDLSVRLEKSVAKLPRNYEVPSLREQIATYNTSK